MKQRIISEISNELANLGIPMQQGNGADITINAEFLNAGWGTGDKKITYEASIFANEQDRVVYMYEKTLEIGHGFSFGSDNETTFQRGSTLFRKVKSVQYGLDGKAYEYTLDLGAIPKTVKEKAKLYGWNFKVAINKNKAMYPVGYAPMPIQPAPQMNVGAQGANHLNGFCASCGAPLTRGASFCDKCGQPTSAAPVRSNAAPFPVAPTNPAPQPAYGNPQGAFYVNAPKKADGKGGTLGLVAYVLLGISIASILALAKGTLFGWIFSAGIFTAAFLLERKMKNRGCVLHLILWIITAFVLLTGVIIFTEGSISGSVTTAKIKNAHMTTGIDDNGKGVDKVVSYSVDTPEFFAVAELRNAPSYTKIKFVWSYVTGDLMLKEYLMDNGEHSGSVYIYSALSNENPWPEGEYKVDMYIDDRTTPDVTVSFTVFAAVG